MLECIPPVDGSPGHAYLPGAHSWPSATNEQRVTGAGGRLSVGQVALSRYLLYTTGCHRVAAGEPLSRRIIVLLSVAERLSGETQR